MCSTSTEIGKSSEKPIKFCNFREIETLIDRMMHGSMRNMRREAPIIAVAASLPNDRGQSNKRWRLRANECTIMRSGAGGDDDDAMRREIQLRRRNVVALIFDEDVIVAERLGRCTRERETTVPSLGYVRSVNRAWRSTERGVNRAWRTERGVNSAAASTFRIFFLNWFLPP